MLKNAATYEIMTPESVGWAKSNLVMGKHSGRAAFRDKLSALGYEIGDNHLNDAFRRFKEMADRKKVVLRRRHHGAGGRRGDARSRTHPLRLARRARRIERPQHAELELEVDGVAKHAVATGDGPVDATFRAIREIFPHNGGARSVLRRRGDRGHRRPGQTTVRLEENGKMVDGQGADLDTIVASARAYVHALNKLMVKRLRTEPQALSA